MKPVAEIKKIDDGPCLIRGCEWGIAAIRRCVDDHIGIGRIVGYREDPARADGLAPSVYSVRTVSVEPGLDIIAIRLCDAVWEPSEAVEFVSRLVSNAD